MKKLLVKEELGNKLSYAAKIEKNIIDRNRYQDIEKKLKESKDDKINEKDGKAIIDAICKIIAHDMRIDRDNCYTSHYFNQNTRTKSKLKYLMKNIRYFNLLFY